MMRWPAKERVTKLWQTEGIRWGKQSQRPTVILEWHPGITTEYDLQVFMPNYFCFVGTR